MTKKNRCHYHGADWRSKDYGQGVTDRHHCHACEAKDDHNSTQNTLANHQCLNEFWSMSNIRPQSQFLFAANGSKDGDLKDSSEQHGFSEIKLEFLDDTIIGSEHDSRDKG